MLSIPVTDTREQTRAVLHSLASEGGARGPRTLGRGTRSKRGSRVRHER